MVEWGERCARHLEGVTRDQFFADDKAIDAVSKCIEVVGTAAKNLMEVRPGFQDRHPELELRKAYATRIRLAHVYRATDPELLWMTATTSIPALVRAARRVLATDEL